MLHDREDEFKGLPDFCERCLMLYLNWWAAVPEFKWTESPPRCTWSVNVAQSVMRDKRPIDLCLCISSSSSILSLFQMKHQDTWKVRLCLVSKMSLLICCHVRSLPMDTIRHVIAPTQRIILLTHMSTLYLMMFRANSSLIHVGTLPLTAGFMLSFLLFCVVTVVQRKDKKPSQCGLLHMWLSWLPCAGTRAVMMSPSIRGEPGRRVQFQLLNGSRSIMGRSIYKPKDLQHRCQACLALPSESCANSSGGEV